MNIIILEDKRLEVVVGGALIAIAVRGFGENYQGNDNSSGNEDQGNLVFGRVLQ